MFTGTKRSSLLKIVQNVKLSPENISIILFWLQMSFMGLDTNVFNSSKNLKGEKFEWEIRPGVAFQNK
jgi:hypothetical protein